jgi:hypothetical protein
MWILCGRSNSPSATKIFLATLKGVISTIVSSVIVVVVAVVAVVVATTRLGVTLPHTNIATNSNSAALVSDCLAKLCALHETGEPLGAENCERLCLNFHSEVNARWKIAIGRLHVEILLFLCSLEQAKGQAVETLMAHRKIGEDEVAGFGWAVQIGHTGGGNTSQNRWVVGSGI